MYPKSFMLEIADGCFACIDHNGKSYIFCASKQIHLQALILNLIEVPTSVFGPGFWGFFCLVGCSFGKVIFLLNTVEFHVAEF